MPPPVPAVSPRKPVEEKREEKRDEGASAAPVRTSEADSTVSVPKRNPFQVKAQAPIVEKAPKAAEPDVIELPNGSLVYNCYTTNHYSLFIRPADKVSNKEYLQILKDTNTSASKANNLTDLPARNDVVAAFFEDGFYRATVIRAEAIDRPIRVGFMDYGNTAEVAFDQIRELPETLKNAKKLAIKCFLAGVDKEKENPALLRKLQATENGGELIAQTPDGSAIVKGSFISLVDPETKESLAGGPEKVSSLDYELR